MKAELKPVTGIVSAVGEVIDRLTLPAREKKQLETELFRVITECERQRMEAQASVIVEEVRGNWLQRSWLPLVMLTFALIVLMGTFVSLPILSDNSRFWYLLEIGLGGYVVGRSGEKMVQVLTRKSR